MERSTRRYPSARRPRDESPERPNRHPEWALPEPSHRLKQLVDLYTGRIAAMALKGHWTEATRSFHQLRELALALGEQPQTLDPFEIPLSETSIRIQTRDQLATIAVFYVGRLGNVPHAEFRRAGIGPAGMEAISKVAAAFGVRLQERRVA